MKKRIIILASLLLVGCTVDVNQDPVNNEIERLKIENLKLDNEIKRIELRKLDKPFSTKNGVMKDERGTKIE